MTKMSGKNHTILHNTYVPLTHVRQKTLQGSVYITSATNMCNQFLLSGCV